MADLNWPDTVKSFKSYTRKTTRLIESSDIAITENENYFTPATVTGNFNLEVSKSKLAYLHTEKGELRRLNDFK